MQTLAALHPFRDAAEALDACTDADVPHSGSFGNYSYLQERGLAASQWLDAHPREAAEARADAAMRSLLYRRAMADNGGTRRTEWLRLAADAADEIKHQMLKLAKLEDAR